MTLGISCVHNSLGKLLYYYVWFVLQAYKHLYQAMVTGPKALERPSWWREVVDKPIPGCRNHEIAPPRAKL